jgi:hypothetical protein
MDQISISVINHMEERLHAHAAKLQSTFDAHTVEEMERYQEILDKIEENNQNAQIRHNNLSEQLNARHDTLLTSVSGYMDRTTNAMNGLHDAFPLDKKGKPDFHGHAAAHEMWIENAGATRELISYVKKVVLAGVTSALVCWVGALIWQGILHGPK